MRIKFKYFQLISKLFILITRFYAQSFEFNFVSELECDY